MDNAYFILGPGEVSANAFIAVHEVFEVHFLAFLDERVDDVNLSALGNFFLEKAPNFQTVVVRAVHRLDGLAARRKLVNDTQVQVAIETHGQGAWDGRGGHNQNMWGDGVFFAEPCTLSNAKSVLFIHNGHAELLEFDRIFQDGMGAH